MRRFLLIVCVFILFVGCDKIDDNGDFGGMWQMTEWRRISDGEILATKYDELFWSVQLDLMQFGLNHGNKANDFYLARFKRTSDSLFIGTVYSRPNDDIVGYDAIAKYGVPDDGKFAIDKLSHSALILRSKDAVLTFRKY